MRRTKREKGRKEALATLMARRARHGLAPTIKEEHRKTASAEFAEKYQTELEQHMQELRDLGLDPSLIGEHEVDPVMCSHCGEPIPWKVILAHRD